MRKVIRKRVRRREDGVDVAADIDAVIAVNQGRGQTSETHVSSHHRVVQESDERAPEQPDAPDRKEQADDR